MFRKTSTPSSGLKSKPGMKPAEACGKLLLLLISLFAYSSTLKIKAIFSSETPVYL
jgi:hypothetical protein